MNRGSQDIPEPGLVGHANTIVDDEDVLSYQARDDLEQVGSAIGFLLAIVVVCALLPRARRMRALVHNVDEEREAKNLERRALDERARFLEEQS